MDELTPATLVEPPRVLLNCILELRIKCGYSNRGCPEYIKLGSLQNHVDQCGFAPAKCENEGCGAEVNKCEKVRHETELCKFRKVECYGCGELKKEMQELKRSQEKANKNLEETRKEMDEKQREMDRKMAVVMENQLRIKEGVKEMRIAMVSSLDKMESIFNDAQIDSPPTQGAQASKPHVIQSTLQIGPPINHDVIIMGRTDKDGKPTNSVEKFCCKEGRWVDLAPMIVSRESASSVVLDNQVIVSGGRTNTGQSDRNEPTDSIEILDLDQCPLKWKMSAAKLPVPLSGHQTFVYEGKLIVIYYYGKNEIDYEVDRKGRDVFNYYCKIWEILLTPPHSARELYSLQIETQKQKGNCFRAALVKDKLFTFISFSGESCKDVKIYDLDKNECREMPYLTQDFIVSTTVQWKNDVILFGLKRQHSRVPNQPTDVIKYNTITGETEILAPMKHRRRNFSAIVTDDVIVAMGGSDNRNSVECYNFHTDTWQAFPVMKESRYLATAVVSPQ
jgi:hypothetical protein